MDAEPADEGREALPVEAAGASCESNKKLHMPRRTKAKYVRMAEPEAADMAQRQPNCGRVAPVLGFAMGMLTGAVVTALAFASELKRWQALQPLRTHCSASARAPIVNPRFSGF